MCYDIAGIVSSSKSYYTDSVAFKVVFHWLQPHLPIFARLTKVWYNDGEAAVAVLRVLLELTTHM
jgi:hypothetical protein